MKPANVLVEAGLEPKLLDFGLAQQVDHSLRLTRPGEIMGTPDYFSPEQAAGDSALDARSDVFSLGSILYELLTGTVPFSGASLQAQVRMIREGDPALPRRLNPSVPGELQNICLKCLEKEPSRRYASARELSDDLARFLAGEPVLASPTSYARLLTGKIDQHPRCSPPPARTLRAHATNWRSCASALGGEGVVDEAAVARYAAGYEYHGAKDITDAISSRDLARALRLLNEVTIKEEEFLGLLGMIGKRLRILWYLSGGDRDVPKEFNVRNAADWLGRDARRFTRAEIERGLEALLLLDERVKSTQVPQKLLLQHFLLAFLPR